MADTHGCSSLFRSHPHKRFVFERKLETGPFWGCAWKQRHHVLFASCPSFCFGGGDGWVQWDLFGEFMSHLETTQNITSTRGSIAKRGLAAWGFVSEMQENPQSGGGGGGGSISSSLSTTQKAHCNNHEADIGQNPKGLSSSKTLRLPASLTGGKVISWTLWTSVDGARSEQISR